MKTLSQKREIEVWESMAHVRPSRWLFRITTVTSPEFATSFWTMKTIIKTSTTIVAALEQRVSRLSNTLRAHAAHPNFPSRHLEDDLQRRGGHSCG